MTIEPIIGIQKRDTILSEKEFSSFSIFSTAQMLKDYFTYYGYHFMGFFDVEKDLIIVKDNNAELSFLTGDFDVYQIINYRTGEVSMKQVSVLDVADKFFSVASAKFYSFTHSIEKSDKGMRLIRKETSNTVLEAESIIFIDYDKVLITNYGFESIFCLDEERAYPIVKSEQTIYMGKDAEKFVDMRVGMYMTFQNTIQPIVTATVNLLELVAKYPYGEKVKNNFRLLSLPIRYGIFYKNSDSSKTKWFSSLEERDQVLKELGVLVETVLEGSYVKIKKD